MDEKRECEQNQMKSDKGKNYSVRYTKNAKKSDPNKTHRNNSKLLKLSNRKNLHAECIIYKIINGIAPPYVEQNY